MGGVTYSEAATDRQSERTKEVVGQGRKAGETGARIGQSAASQESTANPAYGMSVEKQRHAPPQDLPLPTARRRREKTRESSARGADSFANVSILQHTSSNPGKAHRTMLQHQD